uniref:outer membrane protein n=1 Tax=Sphingomonas sp. TaxID=28214 RepID=UPI00286CB85A
MRKLAIVMALASTGLTTPALALDHSGYVGIEAGGMIVEDTVLDYTSASVTIPDAIGINHKRGYDVDAIGGYDFGSIRAELELGYKRANLDDTKIDAALSAPSTALKFPTDGRVSVLSGMVNALLDFGDDSAWNGYVGGGVGYARVKYYADIAAGGAIVRDSDSGLAWQAIAGVRYAISPNMDLGLKYRFFNVNKLNFSGSDGERLPFELDGR